jgi:crotonobetainyl-CoA:carnitine CoA-transferase CaiB-like acyl-CoA transferase
MLANALQGLTVLDFTQVAAGPTCTMMLADMGAEVIKVEPPSGDLARQLEPIVAGESAGFMALNRNKRSIVLDLKNPQHVAHARALTQRCDVLVESFRPGVMDRLGLGAESLRAEHTALIYCSVSAYGEDGPNRDLPGVDGVLQAVTGLMSVTGMPSSGPCKMQTPVVDMVTGYLAAISILGALQARHQSGEGQTLSVSMFSSALALQQLAFSAYLASGEVPAPVGSAAPYAAPNEALRCQDGWIMLAAYHPKRWQALCEVIGAPHLLQDPRFSSNASRLAHRVALVAALEERLVLRPRAYWLEALARVDIICGPIQDYAEVVASSHVSHQALIERVDHPVAGPVFMPRSVLAAAGEHPHAHRPPPTLGQHTQEVLVSLSELSHATSV